MSANSRAQTVAGVQGTDTCFIRDDAIETFSLFRHDVIDVKDTGA